MLYTNHHVTPIGTMIMASGGYDLTHLLFDDQSITQEILILNPKYKDLSIFNKTKTWLDLYFSEQEPDWIPDISLDTTEFQTEVLEIVSSIKYGKTMTYGNIAKIIANKRCTKTMSARAVGAAVGSNPILLIIPCHRVLGVDGAITGYSGGIDRKMIILDMEKTSA